MTLDAQTPNSAATEALIDLLREWTRQVVWASLQTFSDPLQALLDKDVRRVLVHQKRRKKLLNYAHKHAVSIYDPLYPELLRNIPDPPLLLFYWGDLSNLCMPCVAIVGARRCTHYGRDIATRLAADLSKVGIAIISGLATGIDGAVHQGALQQNGITHAFLGGGLGNIYPAQHHHLAEQIVQLGGVVCSEYSHHQTPRPGQFPERNRLISGVSLATVVVEASLRSGSLITARLALEQGRDVLAVPGSVHSHVSSGCHKLIQNGAGLVTGFEDVLQAIGIELRSTLAPKAVVTVSQSAQQILARLDGYPKGMDEILILTALDVSAVMGGLSELELGGFVRRDAHGYIATS